MGRNAEIFKRLSSIEQIVARIDERTKDYDSAQSDHERRIRNLEHNNDKRKGMLTALSLFSSVVGGALVWLFKSIFGGGN